MTMIVPEELNCAVCHEPFQGFVVLSTNSLGPRTSDLRQYAGGADPLPFLVHTCPKCGYSADDAGFRRRRVKRSVLDRVRGEITPLVIAGQPTKGRSYEFAAWVAEWGGATHHELGWLYLSAAWCSGDDGRADEEQRYRRLAIERFESAVAERRVPNNAFIPIQYLIGELYRRVGDRESAKRWFDGVTEQAGSDESERWWAALAIKQRDDPTDFIEDTAEY